MINVSTVFKRLAAVLALLSLLAGCATVVSSSAPALAKGDKIAVLPIINLTQTPQAGARVEALAESLLLAEGKYKVKRYQGDVDRDALFQPIDESSVQQATSNARAQGMKFGLIGSVQEWRYKVGVDGEPAVGVSLKLINLETGEVVWNAAGNKTGWSRSSVSGVGQDLLRSLLSPLLK